MAAAVRTPAGPAAVPQRISPSEAAAAKAAPTTRRETAGSLTPVHLIPIAAPYFICEGNDEVSVSASPVPVSASAVPVAEAVAISQRLIDDGDGGGGGVEIHRNTMFDFAMTQFWLGSLSLHGGASGTDASAQAVNGKRGPSGETLAETTNYDTERALAAQKQKRMGSPGGDGAFDAYDASPADKQKPDATDPSAGAPPSTRLDELLALPLDAAPATNRKKKGKHRRTKSVSGESNARRAMGGGRTSDAAGRLPHFQSDTSDGRSSSSHGPTSRARPPPAATADTSGAAPPHMTCITSFGEVTTSQPSLMDQARRRASSADNAREEGRSRQRFEAYRPRDTRPFPPPPASPFPRHASHPLVIPPLAPRHPIPAPRLSGGDPFLEPSAGASMMTNEHLPPSSSPWLSSSTPVTPVNRATTTTSPVPSDLFRSDGGIFSAEERQELRRKLGRCVECGQVRTHERRGRGVLGRKRKKPVTDLSVGVYKGYHLDCHGGLCAVKSKLGEAVTAEDLGHDRRRSMNGSQQSGDTTRSRGLSQGQHPSMFPPSSAPLAGGGEVAVYCVTVPACVRPGGEFPVRAGNAVLTARCPPDAGPGTRLQITVERGPDVVALSVSSVVGSDGENAESFPRSDMRTAATAPSCVSERMELFQVVAPPDVRPGRPFPVFVGGKRFLVPSPANVSPGGTVLFRLPAGFLPA